MGVNKKRDFRRLSLCIQDFLKRLPCHENTGFLRDTLYLSLLELHKYYLKEKERQAIDDPQTTQDAAVAKQHSTWKDVKPDKFKERWSECEGDARFKMALEENLQTSILTDDYDVLGRTYLMHAIHANFQEEHVEHILSQNVNIDHQAKDGYTALHVASQCSRIEIAALLLRNKADVLIQDKQRRSALHWAARCQSTGLIKLLLQYGADINASDCDGMTPAMWACYFEKLDNLHVLQHALERVDPRPDALFDQQDHMGRSVLHWATMTRDQNGGYQCLKELLQLRDTCKVKDNLGRTVLHTAAIQGLLSASEVILSSCGNDIIDVEDKEGQSALHLATLSGHGEMVDFLLQHGANASALNKNERTALQEAEIRHHHYCLMVYAAFDHVKEAHTETRRSLNTPEAEAHEKNHRDKRRYESWAIPSTSLDDSYNIPTEAVKELVSQQQLVDVSEIKGFEISDEPADLAATRIKPTRKPGNESAMGPEKPDITNDKPATKPDKPATKPDTPATKPDKPATKPDKPATKSDKPASSKDGSQRRTNKNNKFPQRNAKVDETRQMKQQETNIPEDATTTGDDASTRVNPEDLDGYIDEPLSQHESEDSIEISENVSSLNSDAEDEERDEEQKTNARETKHPRRKLLNNSEANRQTKDSLVPLKPSSQASFNDPYKVKTISLRHTNIPQLHGGLTSQSRSLVAPLQHPGIPKEHPGLSLLSRDKLKHHHSAAASHVIRGPGHGPLAQRHGKELLNSVFKDPRKAGEQLQTPEWQRKSMQPAKLSRTTAPRH